MAEIELTRTGPGTFQASNGRGATISMGDPDSGLFTPVELLLAAVAGCAGVDVDVATSRHAEPTAFTITSVGEKATNGEHILTKIVVRFHTEFPQGAGGDRARVILPRAITASHDRQCTVGRTVETGAPIDMAVG